jgi:hypothetical protein
MTGQLCRKKRIGKINFVWFGGGIFAADRNIVGQQICKALP